MIDDFQYKRLNFKKILLGILNERSRWRDCVDWTNKRLGMAVGALFIRDNFSLESKVRLKDKIFSTIKLKFILQYEVGNIISCVIIYFSIR